MESRGVTKRARTDAVEAEQAWKRMVLKLLFLVCRITDWALQILMPKKPDRMQPFSVWPNIPEEKVASDMESLGGFSMVRSEKEDPTPPSPTPSYASQATEGANYVTAEDLALMGRPPTCAHQVPCVLFMTRKQGPNYGRMFWRCPMARGQQCRYFAWTQVQPNWKEPMESSASFTGSPVTPTSQRSTAPKTPERARQEECTHYRTTRAGTNAYVLRVKCEICGKVLKNEARKESDTESARSNKSQASKEPKKKEQTKEPLKMTPEEIDEYEEFQRFRLWQQHRKDARSSGSSARNRKTSPEP